MQSLPCLGRARFLLVLLAFAPFVSPTHGEDAPARPAPAAISEKERQELEAVGELESSRFVAMENVDLRALEKILADDVTYSHSTGVVETKAQFLANLKEGKTKYIAIAPRKSLVRGYCDHAVVVTGESAFHIVAGGRDIHTTLVHSSVYVKRKDDWQLVAWHSSAAPAAPVADSK